MKKFLLILLCFGLFLGCKQSSQSSAKKPRKAEQHTPQTPEQKMASALAIAHHKNIFDRKKAVSFTLKIHAQEQKEMTARVSLSTDFKEFKIVKADGTTLTHNSSGTFRWPGSDKQMPATTSLQTWVNLFELPYRLPKTKIALLKKGEGLFDKKPYNTFTVKMEDAPHFFAGKTLQLFIDPATGFLTALSFPEDKNYFFGKAGAVVYKNYFSLKNVPIAKYWVFYHRQKDRGITGSPLGTATLSKVRFFQPDKNYFQPPKGAVSVD